MRSFANLFLVLFLADGSLSLLDELVSLLSPVAPLSALRNLVANAVILVAVPLYFSLGIDRRLPKRLFLPLILFVFWCPLSTWLFPALAALPGYGLLASAAQVALGTLLISRFRGEGATPSQTLPPALFDAPSFSLRNSLVFGVVTLFVLPVALVTLALFTANSYLAASTSGFIRIQPSGLYMIERVYRRNDHTIRLASMIHVGEKQYYDAVAGSVIPGRTLVLAEGVTDDKGLLRNKFDYGKVASFLGLASQQNMQLPGRVIDAEALEAARPSPAEKEKSGPADILRADLDLSAFRPETILFLNAVGRHMRENPSVVAGAMALNAWAGKNITPQMYEIIMDDILHRRNKVVLHHLDNALKRYDTVIIPWGALHMKEIEAQVVERGFVLQEERKRMSIDFKRMLFS